MADSIRSLVRISTLLVLLGVVAALPGQQPPAKEGEPKKKLTNALGMKFVWIPPGTFVMGNTPVKLTRGFYMGVYPVTQKQWRAVMGNNPSVFPGDSHPVEGVSWIDCQAFLKKLSERDGKSYRLPTEAEWEYACRAGTTTFFHFGNTINPDQANYNGHIPFHNGAQGVWRKKTTPVDTFSPNAWGLYDMHGNVHQWCADKFWDTPLSHLRDAKGLVTDPLIEDCGYDRVVRGGSCLEGPERCTAASRRHFPPKTRSCTVGCRVCFTPEP